jgi:polysaccharide deacetylase family protein (PEP-CTERM system associated)
MYILSFDIEDWFHVFDPAFSLKKKDWNQLPSQVERQTDLVLQLLKEHNLKATFFCLGWVAEKHPSLITTISNAGHQLAAHSFYHRKTQTLTREEFEKDLERSVGILEEISGQKITAYRAPGFSFSDRTRWAFPILSKYGITEDSSLKSGQHFGGKTVPAKPFIIKSDGLEIKEFPTRTFNLAGMNLVYSGSGYFRLFPYWFVKHLLEKSDYEMSYFHPRDFDKDIHRFFSGHPVLQFRYRVGVNHAGRHIHNLLGNYRFITLENACRLINWNEAEVFHL